MNGAPDLLRRAAKTLREHATAATPGPWTTENEYRPLPHCRCLSCHEEQPYARALHEIDGLGEDPSPILGFADADFIALMHPPVALALAELLDDTIENLEQFAHMAGGMRDGDLTSTDVAAIKVARAILREES